MIKQTVEKKNNKEDKSGCWLHNNQIGEYYCFDCNTT